jgi:hypothetical protein
MEMGREDGQERQDSGQGATDSIRALGRIVGHHE